MPHDRLSVRARLEEDLPALVEVLERVHHSTGYPVNLPPDPIGWLTSSRTRASWVADLGGRVVGQVSRADVAQDQAGPTWAKAAGLPTERLAVVKRLFVDPESSGAGVGRALLETVVEESHRLGLLPVLDVDATSTRARRMYERAGFRSAGLLELTWTGLDGSFLAECFVGPPPPPVPGDG